MTDVRLVATNPDDGVLVPVASNASGQLAVQSPKIEKVPNDLEVEGTVTADKFIGDGSSLSNLPSGTPPTPPFDGNLDGDLTVTGTGTFAGDIYANNGDVEAKTSSFKNTTDGVYTYIANKPGDHALCLSGGASGDPTTTWWQILPNGDFNSLGSATFGGPISPGDADSGFALVDVAGQIGACLVSTNRSDITSARTANIGSPTRPWGKASFASDVVIGSRGKQWVITESNGVAMLIEQTRRGQIEPRVREKVRDLPHELDLIEAALNEIMDKLKMTPPAGWEVWDGSDNS